MWLHRALCVTLFIGSLPFTPFGVAYQPEFAKPLANLSVAVGRDATFQCSVTNLGGYRVGWIKADTKAIQAIHDNVITHNPRVSVSNNDQTTWNLHIKAVTEEDRGNYMCQINTDPMKSQVGYLDVVVPPDFIPEETSGDVMVPEGGTIKLTCRARGYPQPHVIWRREDALDIIIKESTGTKSRVQQFHGEVLKLSKITRSEMGAYLCIASNTVRPSVSKRILVSVHFNPVIQVPNQLVGAPLGTSVRIECNVEASPKAINYWVRGTGEMVISSEKYTVETSNGKSMFETKMTLLIRDFTKADVGTYRCIAKNSLGEVDSSIRLYEIPAPPRRVYEDIEEDTDDDEGEHMGSAEEAGDDDLSNTVSWDSEGTHRPPGIGSAQGEGVHSTAASRSLVFSTLFAFSFHFIV